MLIYKGKLNFDKEDGGKARIAELEGTDNDMHLRLISYDDMRIHPTASMVEGKDVTVIVCEDSEDTPEKRIADALACLFRYSQIDGDHHKTWTLDQVTRILTGCPTVTEHRTAYDGTPYECELLGESDEYKAFVYRHNHDESGAEEYSWDCGIAP